VSVDGTFQVNEPPVTPLAIVLTVLRSVEEPFFRVMVTGPSASDQVKSIGWPAVMPLNAELVNWMALARPRETTAMSAVENCMLTVLFEAFSVG